jgi:saccharopine dehydrogenase-like NADP-dependent oxidoreductase
MHRILIIGATGVFGRRLATHLARFEGLELVLASRSPARSEELVGTLRQSGNIRAVLTPTALDNRKGLSEALARIAPWLVIDCSGPFQSMGYDVPKAALEAGAHCIDLADARGYILNFEAALDGLTTAKGLVALTGASSSPAISAAAVEALTQNWQRIDTIDIAITPAGRTDVGEAVTAAVLSYAGKPVPVWREGRLQMTSGWASSQCLAVPGLGRRNVAPVETVDAELLSQRYPVTSRIAFFAGLESPFEHWGMIVLAKLREWGIVKSLMWMLPLLTRARKLTRIPTGEVGAMVVRVSGLNADGRWSQAQWSLLALKGDGPHVPILPAAAAVRALLAGTQTPGARPAAHVFDLATIEAELAPYAITTRQDVIVHPPESLMERAVGVEQYRTLPQALRAFHGTDAPPVWSGRADIEQGRGLIARLIGAIVGLPRGGGDIPVTVSVDREVDGLQLTETWTRNFGGQRFVSVLSATEANVATERFGPLTFNLGLIVKDHEIRFPVTGWRIGALRLPIFLAPRSEAREYVDDEGRFRFDVRLSLPLFGLMAHYRGWLKPGVAARSDSV